MEQLCLSLAVGGLSGGVVAGVVCWRFRVKRHLGTRPQAWMDDVYSDDIADPSNWETPLPTPDSLITNKLRLATVLQQHHFRGGDS